VLRNTGQRRSVRCGRGESAERERSGRPTQRNPPRSWFSTVLESRDARQCTHNGEAVEDLWQETVLRNTGQGQCSWTARNIPVMDVALCPTCFQACIPRRERVSLAVAAAMPHRLSPLRENLAAGQVPYMKTVSRSISSSVGFILRRRRPFRKRRCGVQAGAVQNLCRPAPAPWFCIAAVHDRSSVLRTPYSYVDSTFACAHTSFVPVLTQKEKETYLVLRGFAFPDICSLSPHIWILVGFLFPYQLSPGVTVWGQQ
jgi:hypothetical protein